MTLCVDLRLSGHYNACMASTTTHPNDRLWSQILWTLRVTVCLQCLGNWRWLTQVQETPLLHWLINPTDIGGLAWNESTAFATQQVIGWLVLLVSVLVLWRPHAALLLPLVLLQTLVTVAMWRIADGYSLQVAWVPAQLLTLFPFVTQLARMAAPLGLMLLCNTSPSRPSDQRRIAHTMQMLRWVTAIVFLAHGIEAWQHNPKFVDLLISSTHNVFGIYLTESMAEAALTTIGALDLLLVVACVSRRWLAVMGWMAFWGALTAFSRVLAQGWETSWHEAFTRVPHLGVPLAVALWWHLLKCTSNADSTEEDSRHALAGNSKSVTATT